MYWHTTVPLYQCTCAQVDLCTSVSLNQCIGVSVNQCLCDIIERNRTRYYPIAIMRPSRCYTRPSRGHFAALPKVALDQQKQYKSTPFSFHYFKVFQSRSEDRFLPKCVFCTTSSIQSHFHNRIVSTLVAARTVLKASWGRP